ncbi:hypothetical protein KUCAC02_035211, partial [Chaenocephalus aceratus]
MYPHGWDVSEVNKSLSHRSSSNRVYLCCVLNSNDGMDESEQEPIRGLASHRPSDIISEPREERWPPSRDSHQHRYFPPRATIHPQNGLLPNPQPHGEHFNQYRRTAPPPDNQWRKPRFSPPRQDRRRTDAELPPPSRRTDAELPPPSRRTDAELPPPSRRTDAELPPPSRWTDAELPPPSRRTDAELPPPSRRTDAELPPPSRRTDAELPPPSRKKFSVLHHLEKG